MKTKKFIGGFIIALVAMFASSNSIFAAEKNSDKAIIVVPDVVEGETANTYKTAMFYMYKANCGSGACIISGSKNNVIEIEKWIDVDHAKDMQPTDVFEAGVKYQPKFKKYQDSGIYPPDNYTITNDTLLFVNPIYGTENFKVKSEVTVAEVNAVLNSGNYTGVKYSDYSLTPIELISEVNYKAKQPVIGNMPSKKVSVTTNKEGALSVTEISVVWYEDDEEMDMDTPFKEGKTYYYEPVQEQVQEYVNSGFTLAEDLAITINGQSYYEWGPLEYTYKFLDNTASVKGVSGKLKSLSFRIDAKLNEFEYFKIGNLELVNGVDFELTKGSTVITLTDKGLEKVNALEKGSYDVIAKFTSNDDEVVGSLVLEEEVVNPKTGDNILLYMIIGFISLVGFGASSIVLKKRNN